VENEHIRAHLLVLLDVLGELSCDNAMARPTVELGVRTWKKKREEKKEVAAQEEEG
jgi:hypothetical protein